MASGPIERGVSASAERRLGLLGRVGLVGLVAAGTVLATAVPFTLLFFVSYCAVGALLAIRRPANAIGWLLVAMGFAFVFVFLTTNARNLDDAALVAGTAGPRDALLVWLASWVGGGLFAGFLTLTLLFPSGELPLGRWRRPALAVLIGEAITVVLTAIGPTITYNPEGGALAVAIPNPFAILPNLPLWSVLPTNGDGLFAPIFALMAAGVVSMVVRYRHSSGTLRLQLRWLTAALSFVLTAVIAGIVLVQLLGDTVGSVAWLPAIVAFPTVPLAIGVAVLRYRLFEIDRIISRTIAYGGVTGLLVATFAGSILLLQAVLAPVTQGQTVAVAASTLAVAALFQPVMRRVRRAVDRRFDRARYDAERTAAAFSERLRDEVDLEATPRELLASVVEAIQPRAVAVWIRASGRTR